MLFARSSVVTAAKAYGLQAIDMVCINYLDMEELEKESREGREIGFDGKVSLLSTNCKLYEFEQQHLICWADFQPPFIASDSPKSSFDNSILVLTIGERDIKSSGNTRTV